MVRSVQPSGSDVNRDVNTAAAVLVSLPLTLDVVVVVVVVVAVVASAVAAADAVLLRRGAQKRISRQKQRWSVTLENTGYISRTHCDDQCVGSSVGQPIDVIRHSVYLVKNNHGRQQRHRCENTAWGAYRDVS